MRTYAITPAGRIELHRFEITVLERKIKSLEETLEASRTWCAAHPETDFTLNHWRVAKLPGFILEAHAEIKRHKELIEQEQTHEHTG